MLRQVKCLNIQLVINLAGGLFCAVAMAFPASAGVDIEAIRQSQTEREALSHLPGQTLSLPFVIAQAALSSETFQAVQALAIDIEAPTLKSKALLGTRLVAEGSVLDNRLATSTELQPSRIYNTRTSLGVEKGLATGTRLSVRLIHERTDQRIDFETNFPAGGGFDLSSDFMETRLEFGMEQPLWNNAFGRTTQRQLKTGKMLSDVAELELQEAIEQWFDDFSEIFYNAWLAQSEVIASESSLERRKRLLEMTNIRMRRGTAERPDLLQAQSAVIESENSLDQAKKNIQDIWRGLVVGLNLPEHWIDFDPMKVPLEATDVLGQAIELCGPESNLNAGPSDNAETQKLAIQSQVAQQELESAKDGMRPEASLFLNASTNAVDSDSRATTFGDVAKWDNNSIQVGVSLSVPLERFTQRAQLKESLARERRLSAMSSQARKNLNVSWMNTCGELYQKKRYFERLERIFDNQRERVRLEEERFRIGRVQMLSVIQAGDDAAAAELGLRAAERNLHITSWQVLGLKEKIVGTIDNFIDTLQEGVM